MKPVFPTYILKRRAKAAMQGRFFKALAIAAVPLLTVLLCTALVLAFMPGAKDAFNLAINGKFETYEERVMYFDSVMNISTTAVSLFSAVFAFLSVGAQRLFLDMLRGKDAVVKNIFCFYDKWYIAAVYPVASAAAALLITYILDFLLASGMNTDAVMLLSWALQLAVYFIAAKLMFVEFILADTDCKNVLAAMKASWKMVGWNTAVNFVTLALSFVGWIILSAFTGGLLLIYVIPYMSLSIAALYEENRKYNV
ncbi:MAG: hypothetical protein IJ435_08055 [Clostridia bacterium]|nr:hypothetical protein [Clostridia bacterium]